MLFYNIWASSAWWMRHPRSSPAGSGAWTGPLTSPTGLSLSPHHPQSFLVELLSFGPWQSFRAKSPLYAHGSNGSGWSSGDRLHTCDPVHQGQGLASAETYSGSGLVGSSLILSKDGGQRGTDVGYCAVSAPIKDSSPWKLNPIMRWWQPCARTNSHLAEVAK